MRSDPARSMAFGGVMAALATVIMSLGGLIPVATFVCPMLAMVVLTMVLGVCGRRVAWAWYAAVAVLSLLLSPDKEAAMVFLFLGYYPIVKPKLDRWKAAPLGKLLFFNGVILLMYGLMLNVLGMEDIREEFREAGQIMTAVMLALGNLIFFLLDRLLDKRQKRGEGR